MLTDPGRLGTYGKTEDLKGKHMRWPHSLQQLLQFFSSIVHVFTGRWKELGLLGCLVVGIFIVISITSGMCAIMIMIDKASWTEMTTTVKVLGVEWLILVISVVVWWFAIGGPWYPY